MIRLVPVNPDVSPANDDLKRRASESKPAKYTKHYLAFHQGKEVAFIALDEDPYTDYLVLYEIFVSTHHRRKGIGTAILSHLDDFARSHHYTRIVLFPHPLDDNLSVAELTNWYTKRGYSARPNSANELEKRT